MTHDVRHIVLIAGLAGALAAACGQADDANFKPVPIKPFLADAVLGKPDAPVEIVEYASTTCHGCRQFHTTLLPEIKATYIDTGKAKLVYRVMPTPPADISAAGAAIARCAGEAKFHDVIADLFENQPKILDAAKLGQARRELIKVGGRFGLSGAEVRTCIADKAIDAYTRRVANEAPAYVTHTPSLIIGGDYIETNTREAIMAAIDKHLPATIVTTQPSSEQR